MINPPKTAIRIKGTDSIKINCENNPKENITIGCTISAGGSFLKPLLIAKGKTKRCLYKYNLTDEIIGTYTESGWANEDCIILLLDQIASITHNEQSILLLDQHGSHTTDKVCEYAKSKNINLIFIPTGLTYKYQPLDVAINGILKNKARSLYASFLASNPEKTYTREQCIRDFINNKKSIKKGIIIRAFDCLDRSKNKDV